MVIDWLPPDQQPGIPGTKLTQVTRWESAANQIKKSFKDSHLFQELIDEVITAIKREIKTRQAGANATGGKEQRMPVATVTKEDMSMDILETIKALPDKDAIVTFMTGVFAGMGISDDKAADDMGDLDDEPMESDYPADETGKESFKRASALWESKKKIVPFVKAAVEKHQKALAVRRESSPAQSPMAAASAAVPEVRAGKLSQVEAREIMTAAGFDVAELDEIQRERKAQKEAGKRSKVISESKKKAVESKTDFYGHPIWDQSRYPDLLLEKAIKDCSEKCVTEREVENFFSERLTLITKEAQLETIKQNAQPLPGKQHFEFSTLQMENGGHVGEVDPWVKIAQERVAKPLLAWMEHNEPEKYAIYKKNSENETFNKKVMALAASWAKVYREEFLANGLDQNGNYPAILTGLLAMVQQWIPSPLMQLAQSGPNIKMTLGRGTMGQAGMPLGQFVEIWSTMGDQVKDYDLAERQLATDGLPQMQFYSKPYQYFARWREWEIVNNKDALYWLSIDPLKRDLNAEALFWLMQNMTKHTELMLSAENIRSTNAYGATGITNETLNLAQADHFHVFTGGESKTIEGKTISNAVGYFKLRRGQASGTVTLLLGPIVPPGISPFLERSSESLVNAHPVILANINGKVQSRGKYDSNLQKGVKINEGDPDPTFIVFDHVGIVVMLEGSNFDGVNATVVSQYSMVNNYVRYNALAAGSETGAFKANQLAELILSIIGEVRSKRQVEATAFDYLIGGAGIVEGLLPLGTHFQGQNKLDFASIGSGMTSPGTAVERLRNTLMWGTTDPFYVDGRLLTLGDSSNLVYRPYHPPILGDVQTCGKVNADGKVARTHQQAQSMIFRELIATIPTRNPVTDAPANFANTTIFITDLPASNGLPS